jgi:transcriptional regulator with XRE-family HTH domain
MQIDGKKLRHQRLDKFLSQEELAERAGIHRDHLGKIETGTWSGPSRPTTIRRLAEALDIDPHELLVKEKNGSSN